MTGGADNNAGLGFAGTWELEVNTPFGKHPATLTLTPEGGDIQSRLGNIALDDLKYEGDSFPAPLAYHTHGRIYTATVAAHPLDGRIEGVFKVALPLAPPVKFTGHRVA